MEEPERRVLLGTGAPSPLKKMKRFFCFCAVVLLLASCGPSYPRERVVESLIGLCKREYKLDIQAQLVQSTLGVQVIVPGLIEELMKNVSGEKTISPVLVEGQYEKERFDFQFLARGSFVRVEKQPDTTSDSRANQRERSAPFKILDHVSTAMQRVVLSTDAPLEFYTLIARDPGPANLDVLFTGHVYDLKRGQYMDISRGELQRRSGVSLRHQPEEVARQTVRDFLMDLSVRPLPQLLSRYAAASKRFGELLPQIIDLAASLQGKEQFLLKKEWPVRQIKADEALVYVSLSPLQMPGAVLLSVNIREGQGSLLNIERLESPSLSSRYASLGPPEKWKEFFYLEPMSLPQFLTEQISKRVLSEFQPMPPPSKKGEPPVKSASNEEVTRVLVETSAYVLDTYRFNGFQELTVTDATRGTRWVVPAKDLPLYRRRNAPALQPLP